MKKMTITGLVTSSITLALMCTASVQASFPTQHTGKLIQQLKHEQLVTDIKCLALNVYHEARGESTIGQRAVAWVTVNRVTDPNYPKDICSVVYDPDQFSWTNDNNSDQPTDLEAYRQALIVALQVVQESYTTKYDPTEGSVMFHSTNVDPFWADNYDRVTQIDNHVFYKDIEL